MTRNEAYKAAKGFWKGAAKRGAVTLPMCWQTIAYSLYASGCGHNGVAMVKLWLKAFYSGRRFPSEAAMKRVENVPT